MRSESANPSLVVILTVVTLKTFIGVEASAALGFLRGAKPYESA